MPKSQSEKISLTPREGEVFQLVREGYSPKAIALEMRIHRRTVDDFLTKLRRKFSVQTHYQLILATAKFRCATPRVQSHA